MPKMTLEQLEANVLYALRTHLLLIKKLYKEKGFTEKQYDDIYMECIDSVWKSCHETQNEEQPK